MPVTLCCYFPAMPSDSRPVYSTASGRLCPDCQNPLDSCRCKALRQQVVKGDGIVRVARETKGRAGKGVTLIKGLPLTEPDLKAIATRMKQFCGTGGTIKDGVIEIQGDNRDKLLAWLLAEGYKANMAGG